MPRTRTSSRSVGESIKHLGTLSLGLAANAADLPHLDAHRQQLEAVVTQARSLLSGQKIQTAAKQDTSRQLEAILDQGEKLGAFLKAGVRQHYGRRSEKLVEFDLQPFRGKPQPVKPPAPEPPVPELKPKVESLDATKKD
jgi:hypothetical protein